MLIFTYNQLNKNKMAERQSTIEEQEVFEYLNDLRESGATNMFGAPPYVEREFSISKSESRKIVSLWMNNFSESGDYETIKD